MIQNNEVLLLIKEDLLNQFKMHYSRCESCDVKNAKEILFNIKKIRKEKYDKTILFTYDIELHQYLKFTKFIMLLTGSKKKIVCDTYSNKIEISWKNFIFFDLFKLIIGLIFGVIVLIRTYITVQIYLKKSKKYDINFNFDRISYLRTDHWFDVRAGGSVAHISGVANAFHEFGNELFFISSDKLISIDVSKTALFICKPSFEYFDYLPEIAEMAYTFQLIKKVKKIFKKEKPTVIYQRYSQNNFAGILLSKMFKIPLIIEYNSSNVWKAKYWSKKLRFQFLTRKIEFLNLRWADQIVVVSKELKKEVTDYGINSDKILVNPNGVDPKNYNPSIIGNNIRERYNLDKKILIGFIGTFGQWHGADVLAEAAKLLVNKTKNFSIIFIGDGPMIPVVKEIISQNNLNNYTIFTGIIPQKKAPEYLAACDILVSPTVPNEDGSGFFGSPTKLFEYMAMGKGIVASNIGQISAIIKNNENGILVKPADVNELSEGLFKLIEDKKLREKLGSNAFADVIDNHTWEEHVVNIINFTQDLHENN